MADEPKPGETPLPKPDADAVAAAAKAAAEKDAQDLTSFRESYTVPEKYELALPKDSKLDASFTEGAAAIARELGLSQKKAEQLFASLHGTVSAREAAFLADNAPPDKEGLNAGKAWLARDKGWSEAALKDETIGGTPEKLKANAELGKRVLDHFEEPEIGELLHKTGLGSHPTVLRFLVKVANSMKEADFHKSPPGGGDSKPKENAVDRMYPTHKKEKKA